MRDEVVPCSWRKGGPMRVAGDIALDEAVAGAPAGVVAAPR